MNKPGLACRTLRSGPHNSRLASSLGACGADRTTSASVPRKFTYFVKIVAVPSNADLRNDGNWYTAGGDLIGYAIWGDFAVVQEDYNDPFSVIADQYGMTAKLHKDAVGPGLGSLKY